MSNKVNKVNQVANQQASDEVFDAIHALMHLYRAQQYQVVRETGHGLTHLEGKVLGFFARHPAPWPVNWRRGRAGTRPRWRACWPR